MKFTLKQYLLLFSVILILSALYLSNKSNVASCIKNGSNINFLIAGTDWVDYAQHADTIIFASYNPKKRFLDVISVPRDTKIYLPDLHLNRINEVYAYFYRKEKKHKSAIEGTSKVLSNILHNRVQIPFYFQVDYTSFKKLIDSIGGVKIEIEEPMQYKDHAGKLNIDFKPGIYILDGEKALEYVRFRGQAGDIGRIYRQQIFLKAMLNKLKNPIVLVVRMPKLLKFIFYELNTNFTFWDKINLVFELKNLNLDNIRLAQLPGKPYQNYWLPDEEEIDRVLNLIYGPEINFQLSSITVEVCNASSHSGAARILTRKLRDFGFDVIDWKNYPTKQAKTIVVDRVGNLKAAQSIAKIINTEEIFTRYDSKRFVDISVIIGEDYKDTEKIYP